MTKERIHKLQNLVKMHAIDILIVDNTTDLFYLTGLKLSAGKLLITPEECRLFVDNRYLERASQHPFIHAALFSDTDFAKFISNGSSTIAFDAETTTYSSFLSLNKLITTQKLLPLEHSFVKELRCIKDAKELQLLRNAASLCSTGYDHVLTLLKEGISEKEVAIELEIFWKKSGADALSFDSIIAFGANSSMPHHRASATSLKSGDIVLIDIGVTLESYVSDMTRTLFFGPPHPKLQELYLIVKEAQTKALQACKANTPISYLNTIVEETVQAHNYSEYLRHGLGHGIGLEIHERPSLKTCNSSLEENMAITIEPGLYLPNLGGVRIENSILITKDGFEDLTRRSTDILIL